jgi:hypothetical protein
LVLLLSLWLVATVAVAFLREAKAVRDSRELLAQERAQEAWVLLAPFLGGHPEHQQALFLCGKATIRLSLETEAKQCLERLGELSPELTKSLDEDYRQVLSWQSRSLPCDVSAFGELLARAETLGQPYSASVLAGLDGVIEACRTARNEYEPWRFAALMAEKGWSANLVDQGYVPAIKRAASQTRYADAAALAHQAVRMVPDGSAAVEAALEDERGKVSQTVETLRGLCSDLQVDAKYRADGSWCFPAEIPPAVQAARDGWGRGLLYGPFDPDATSDCHQGFALTSYGGDAAETPDDYQSPAAEIVCSFVAGWESWQVPNRFWLSTRARTRTASR